MLAFTSLDRYTSSICTDVNGSRSEVEGRHSAGKRKCSCTRVAVTPDCDYWCSERRRIAPRGMMICAFLIPCKSGLNPPAIIFLCLVGDLFPKPIGSPVTLKRRNQVAADQMFHHSCRVPLPPPLPALPKHPTLSECVFVAKSKTSIPLRPRG